MKPRALVMGFGRFGGGLGAARHLLANGFDVTVTDLASKASLASSLESLSQTERAAVTWRLDSHDEADFTAAELVIVNPAVPPTSRFLEVARAAGARITSEVELFLELAEAELVLITGTQGKSSTAHLTHGLLEQSGRHARLAGNIGCSLLGELPGQARDHEFVVELSSYQLDALPTGTASLAKAAVGIITNLLEDHLARHGDVASYHAAKLRITELVRPGGLVLLPPELTLEPGLAARLAARGIRTATCSAKADGTKHDDSEYRIESGHFVGPSGQLAALSSLQLPGAYQRSNALFALAAAAERSVAATDLDQALARLGGLEHRSEPLGHFGAHAIRVVDNAVSTTPDSTESGFEATGSGPVVLLVGGRSKGLPLERLAANCAGRLRTLVAFGEAADEFAAAFAATGARTHTAATVEAAVTLGFELAQPGDTLLFSPAGSSFDAYSNFKERARAFRAALPQAAPRRTAGIEL